MAEEGGRPRFASLASTTAQSKSTDGTTSSGSWSHTEVVQRLQNGQLELRRIRWRAGALLLLIGFVSSAVYVVQHYVMMSTPAFRRKPQAYAWEAFAAILFHGRLILVGLVPCAHDKCMLRLTLLSDSLFLAVTDVMNLILISEWSLNENMQNSEWGPLHLYIAADACFVVGTFAVSASRDGACMQRSMWRLVGAWVLAYLLITVYLAAADTERREFSTEWVWVVIESVCLVMSYSPKAQERMRRALNLRLEAHSSRCAAAALAGLAGNCPPKEVLELASRRFRSVRLSSLSPEELADNTPDPELFGRSEVTKLHKCDAFVSHSWHDDPQAKWAALQSWREKFVKEKDREPRVWIDKCCIDQRNIDSDLRCLPVFVSGCKRMVVLCGPTYLSRLWCIVELCTFVHMGGKVENLEFVPVYSAEGEEQDLDMMREAFRNFKAQDCTCFLPDDKERILEIIRHAYVETERFNVAVREIFERSRWHFTQGGAGGGRSLTREGALAHGSTMAPDLSLPLDRGCVRPRPTSPHSAGSPWAGWQCPSWPPFLGRLASATRFGQAKTGPGGQGRLHAPTASVNKVRQVTSDQSTSDDDSGEEVRGEDTSADDKDIVDTLPAECTARSPIVSLVFRHALAPPACDHAASPALCADLESGLRPLQFVRTTAAGV